VRRTPAGPLDRAGETSRKEFAAETAPIVLNRSGETRKKRLPQALLDLAARGIEEISLAQEDAVAAVRA